MFQVFAFLFLAIGLRVTGAMPALESEVTIGGPFGSTTDAPKPPPFAIPDIPAVTPPIIEISDAITTDAVASTTGSPNVTVPAQAIAEAHVFPLLPKTIRAAGTPLVRLLVFVNESGSVSDAKVQASSGIATLDQLAIDWVKTHWRYRPALRGGIPYAVETTAVVAFVRA